MNCDNNSYYVKTNKQNAQNIKNMYKNKKVYQGYNHYKKNETCFNRPPPPRAKSVKLKQEPKSTVLNNCAKQHNHSLKEDSIC